MGTETCKALLPTSTQSSVKAFAASAIVFLTVFNPSPADASPGVQLSFEERVQCQAAIEEVYWRHRIWPQDNPGPKPAFDEVMPRKVIKRKVEDALAMSAILAESYGSPIEAEDLQEELDRMARGTHDTDRLSELFAALGSDPTLAAECLARPLLAERRLRAAYAYDSREHGDQGERARAEVSAAESLEDLSLGSGVKTQLVFRRRGGDAPSIMAGADRSRHTLDVDRAEWDAVVERLTGSPLGTQEAHLEELHLGQIGPLREEVDRFVVQVILSAGEESLELATVSWPKRSFEEWLEARRARANGWWSGESSDFNYALPMEEATGGTTAGLSVQSDSPNAGAPRGALFHTAIWTGTEMVVWGGFSDPGRTENTGGRYNPATDTWTPTSVSSAPGPKAQHTAVWTGTEMVVWGWDLGGGRYNPSTDTWAPISDVSEPSNRDIHTAIWTGTEMVVWGGRGGPDGVLATGGRYNPVTDSWAATSMASAPEARDWHTAVWTGSEMVVWGGGGAAGALNTGGRYNPATNTWVPTSVSSAPSAGGSNPAIWTGTQMVIWGGASNTSGRYFPGTDSWLPISAVAAPSPRDAHTAVWAGTRMLVWGGTWNSVALNTGGQYNPNTNAWTSMSAAAAPSGRVLHTAVWTGTEMLVWGGLSGNAFCGYATSGGRYRVSTDSWASTSGAHGFLCLGDAPRQLTDGTRRVEVLYDLYEAPASGETISVKFMSTDGTSTIIPAAGALTGVGPGKTNGLRKRILWDAASTLAPGTFGTFYTRVAIDNVFSTGSYSFTIDLRSGTYVEISTIASPQTAGVAFPVTFTVKDAGGTTIQWNGNLVLTGLPSSSPGQVQVVNGVGTKQVVLDTPGSNVVLSATGGGVAGASNPFTLQPAAGGCVNTWLDASVRSGGGVPISGAAVHLASGQSCTTSASGTCRLADVPPGEHDAWAVASGMETDHRIATVTCNPGNALTLEVFGSSCNPAGLTPVLLVPGIMGSTIGCGSVWPPIPVLPERPPRPGDWCSGDTLLTFHGLLDPNGLAGWGDLVDALETYPNPPYELLCTIFPVPYDWRMQTSTAADVYLRPMIEAAKRISGMPRVDVVAHSMGGLVARDYINSQAPGQPIDIDRLVMVGTPNHGAVLGYFLWEGGDPVLADAVKESMGDGVLFGFFHFYSHTTHELYRTYYGNAAADLLPEDRDEYWFGRAAYRRSIRHLMEWHVPAVRELLPTSETNFLLGPSGGPRGIVLPANTNDALGTLNTDLSRFIRPDWAPHPNFVRAQILASQNIGTLRMLKALDSSANSALEFFEDGVPRVNLAMPAALPSANWLLINATDLSLDQLGGDGTAQRSSAWLPDPLWFMPRNRGGHAGLVKQFIPEIVDSLTGFPTPPGYAEAVEVVTPRLGLRVSGRFQPLLANPAGQRLGVEPGTATLLEEIPGGTVELGAEGGTLGLDLPADGSYDVALAGAYIGEFLVSADYVDGTASATSSRMGYFDGVTPFTFSFTVDSQSPGRLAVNLAPPPPVGLQSNFSAGNTELSWEPSSDPGVSGYAVYGKQEIDRRLSRLGTTAVESFATGHQWAADEGDVPRQYAVAARYADGHEGFLSKTVMNNDRDHDGMIDAEETRRGTAIGDPDTDDDGLADGVEDGLGTDPIDTDSDGDGYPDGEEVAGGFNPLDPGNSPLNIFSDDFDFGVTCAWSAAVGSGDTCP